MNVHPHASEPVRDLVYFKIKMAGKSCELLEGEKAAEFIAYMDTFIFDCDGKWIKQ